MTKPIHYKHHNNTVIDQDGNQIAVVLPTNCSKKEAKMMAAYCAQQMNFEQRRKVNERELKLSMKAIESKVRS